MTSAWESQAEPRAEATGGSGEEPLLRTLGFGALVEILWGLGLVLMLGVVSVTLWAVLHALARI